MQHCRLGYANFGNNEKFHLLHFANQIETFAPPLLKSNFQVQDTTKKG
jgi:hypothetical protein